MRPRDNPFRSERIDALPFRFLDGSWDQLWSRLGQLGNRGAIVGHEGSGKTTLQHELCRKLQDAGRPVRWLRMRRELRSQAGKHIDGFLSHWRPDETVFVDGAEQIGPIRWRSFTRRIEPAAGLIITTHAPGRLPTLIKCCTTVDLLDAIVVDLAGKLATELRPLLPELFARHAGNIRLCLRDLYDQVAR